MKQPERKKYVIQHGPTPAALEVPLGWTDVLECLRVYVRPEPGEVGDVIIIKRVK